MNLVFFKKILFIYLLAVLGVCCFAGSSLAVANVGYSLAVVCEILIVVASFIAEL